MSDDEKPRRSRAQVVIEKPETQALARLDPQALMVKALESNAGIETLERVMALAERAQAWSARQAYNQAITQFQRRCPQIKKTRRAKIGDTFAFTYAPLEDVMTEIRPLMTELGLSASWRQAKASTTNAVAVVCRITHDGGHWEEAPEPTQIPYLTSGRLSPGQVVSAANSFAKRLSVMNMLGIVPEGEDIEDDDAEDAAAAAAAERRATLDRDERAAKEQGGPPVREPKFSDIEQADLYQRFKARCLALKWSKEQVINLLKKHNLSPGLVAIDADWSKVDPSVMRDMLTEAGG